MNYQHRQSAKLMRFLMIVALALFLSMDQFMPGKHLILPATIIVIVLWLFGSLNVIVSETEVLSAFGPGLIKRRIPVSNIVSTKIVQNSWIWGWGIRIIPHGIMFNVSGLDAVELELRTGAIFRIGTDEPGKLEAAIRDVMQRKSI